MVKFSLRVQKVPRLELSRAKKYHVTRVVILGKSLQAPIASLTRAFLVPGFVCGEYYNLCADRTCALPAVVLGEVKYLL